MYNIMAQFIEYLKTICRKVWAFFGVEGLMVLLLNIVLAEVLAILIPSLAWVGVVAWFLFLIVDVLWIYKTRSQARLWLHMLAAFLGILLGLILVGLLKI